MTNARSLKLSVFLCFFALGTVFASGPARVPSRVSAPLLRQTAAVAGNQGPNVAGATNYMRLDENFASGGVTTPDAFAAIKQLGFRTVINLRTAAEPGADPEGEARTVAQAGLKYFSLPFSPSAPDLASVDKFLALAKDAGNQPIYVHCQSGQRANAFWMIKRVLLDGWTIEKAVAEADTLKMTNQRLRDFAIAYVKDHDK